jgi:hypothetical protein
MLTVDLKGGLGNQLFMLGFLDYASKITERPIFISTLMSPQTVHSREQYFNTIFKKWAGLYNPSRFRILPEPNDQSYQDWKRGIESTTGDIMLWGYFQRYEYMDAIRDTFIPKLSFDESILKKHNVTNKIGIHIRGGDYKGNSFHELGLKNYYQKCMTLCPNSEFVIFTNDIPYATEMVQNCEIIQESEVNTLFLMSKCKGLICANSSFSWWGAYLNPNRPIFMPSKWYGTGSIGNYYFNGVTVIDINV